MRQDPRPKEEVNVKVSPSVDRRSRHSGLLSTVSDTREPKLKLHFIPPEAP